MFAKSSMIKVIVDTNIFISGLLCGGFPQKLLDAWEDGEFQLITSDKIIEELISVLDEPRFDDTIDEDDSARLISLIKRNAMIVHPAHNIHVCRDPKDNMIIETAVAAKADMIVSGDKDLLELGQYQAIKILSPKEFLGMLKK